MQRIQEGVCKDFSVLRLLVGIDVTLPSYGLEVCCFVRNSSLSFKHLCFRINNVHKNT